MSHQPPILSAKKRTYTDPFIRRPESVPKGQRFEPRDKEILVDIYDFEGVLTNCQVEALHFAPDRFTDNPRSAKRSAETRMQYLYHTNKVDRIPVQSLSKGRSTIANTLAPEGVDFVASFLGIDRAHVNWRPRIMKNKPTSHYHSMLVNDVRLVCKLISRTTGITVELWIGERAMKSQRMRAKLPFLLTAGQKSYKKAPDGFFTLTYPQHEYPQQQVQPVGFFLEVDRGTESNGVWAEKVRAYEQFRQNDLARQHYEVSNFRILVTTTSPRRLNNLVNTTRKAGGGPFYWFTTQDNVDIFHPQRFLGDVWTVAGWQGQYALNTLKLKPML